MGVKYIRRDGKTITIDTETGKEIKFGDRLKNKIRKGVINFSNKPFGLDYSKYKGTDQWDDKKKRFLTQSEVNKRDTSNLPDAKKTSASIRGNQKKNDKSSNNLKINKEEKKEVSKNNDKKDNKETKVDTKTAFSQDKPLIEKKEKKSDKLKVKSKRAGYVSDPRNKGRKYAARSAQGMKLANKLKARKRAQEAARKRKEKK